MVTPTARQPYEQRRRYVPTVCAFQSFQLPQKFDTPLYLAINVPNLTISEETKKKQSHRALPFFFSIWDSLSDVVEKALLANFCKCRLSRIQIGQLRLEAGHKLG